MNTNRWELDPNKFLSKEDASRLQMVARKQTESGEHVTIRDHFIICLGLATGLRVMEIASLKCGDLGLEDTIPSLVVIHGKGKKKRRVFINGSFKKQCKEFLVWKQHIGESTESDQPLLLSSSTGGHLTTRAIQKAFKRCARRAGLLSHYSIHCLRHYAEYLIMPSKSAFMAVQMQHPYFHILVLGIKLEALQEC